MDERWVALVGLVLATGCVKATSQPEERRILKQWTERSSQATRALVIELASNAEVDGVLEGTAFAVSSCTDLPHEEVEIRERTTYDETAFWVQTGIGVAMAAGGTYLLVRSPDYSDVPEDGAESSDQERARSIGGTLAVVGAVVTGHAVYVALSSGDETHVVQETKAGKVVECERVPLKNSELQLAGSFLGQAAQTETDAEGHFRFDLAGADGLDYPAASSTPILQIGSPTLPMAKVELGAWLQKPYLENRCSTVEDCVARLIETSKQGDAYRGIAKAVREMLYMAAKAKSGECAAGLEPLTAAPSFAEVANDAGSMCTLSAAEAGGDYGRFHSYWRGTSGTASQVVKEHARQVSQKLLTRESATFEDCQYHAEAFPEDTAQEWFLSRCVPLKYGVPLDLLTCCSSELPIVKVIELQRAGTPLAQIAQQIEDAPFRELTTEELGTLRDAGVEAPLLSAIQASAQRLRERVAAEEEAEREAYRRRQEQQLCVAGCSGRYQACIEMSAIDAAVMRGPATTGRCDGQRNSCLERCGAR